MSNSFKKELKLFLPYIAKVFAASMLTLSPLLILNSYYEWHTPPLIGFIVGGGVGYLWGKFFIRQANNRRNSKKRCATCKEFSSLPNNQYECTVCNRVYNTVEEDYENSRTNP